LDPSSIAHHLSGESSNRLILCPSCGKKAPLVELTAEDVQRTHAPRGFSSVCVECREKYRSAARLEVKYPTNVAVRDLALTTTSVISAIFLFSYLLLSLKLPPPVSVPQIVFFTTAATSLTGLKMTYNELGRRYGFTHDLRWSLHSRYAIVSISLVLSGALAAISLTVLF
jgi:hypothetical protein